MIVLLATGLEIFFRDIYCSGMTIKHIKQTHEMFSFFSNESRNAFINIENTMKIFKERLNINLKDTLLDSEIKIIRRLFLKRNVIVHNNGFVDRIFLNQSGIECKQGKPVPIQIGEIEEYLYIVNSVIKKIEIQFDGILIPEIHEQIDEFLEDKE